MKVTYNWLKDFVEIKIPPEELAQRLTMAGLEVTSLEEKGGDFIFEMEITSNRPDCLSVIGVAREVAAITNSKLKSSCVMRHAPCVKSAQRISIEIENRKDCPLYTAKIIKDVKVGPSPDWLKERLELIGCRSLNNIVDITNYVLFSWGEPLHAFDLDKLTGQVIIVRRGQRHEKITSIDGAQRVLDPDMLVIADKEKPVAVAGIMGGRDTEVTESTKNILLEAAIFNPIIVRRTRQRLGLESESSYRFERGVDLETVQSSSWQAVRLIQELADGGCVLTKFSGLTKTKKRNIDLDVSGVEKILGVSIAKSKIKNILNRLEFKVRSKAKNIFLVEIPSHRQDVQLEIDLIEEIARIFGYANIPKTLPPVTPQVTSWQAKDLVSFVKNLLVGLGLNEVITYSLMDQDLWEGLGPKSASSAIEILNPLSKEQAILRPGLALSLAKCVAYNLNQKQSQINIFEVAQIFFKDSGQTQEELVLGIALCGLKHRLLGGGAVKDEFGFLHLKGILEVLFGRLGIKEYNFEFKERSSEVEMAINKEKIGLILSLPKIALEEFDIKNKEVWVAELSLGKVLPYVTLKKRYLPLPAYPGISRDISFILKEDIRAGKILEAIKEKGGGLLKEIKIADYYKGKQIPSGFKGLTISCLYRSDERTLTEKEVEPLHSSILDFVVEKFGAQIR